MCMNAWICFPTYTHAFTHTHTNTLACTHAMHTRIHSPMHTHTHSHTLTHTHTHTHTHTGIMYCSEWKKMLHVWLWQVGRRRKSTHIFQAGDDIQQNLQHGAQLCADRQHTRQAHNSASAHFSVSTPNSTLISSQAINSTNCCHFTTNYYIPAPWCTAYTICLFCCFCCCCCCFFSLSLFSGQTISTAQKNSLIPVGHFTLCLPPPPFNKMFTAAWDFWNTILRSWH